MADNGGPAGRRRFEDELAGLDPNDPEVQEFAAHLDRMERTGPSFTVEGSIKGVGEFADASNRAGGGKWLAAVIVVCLILFGILFAAWDTIGRVLMWLSG
ncbi:hypothetical protein [Amycolatopsis aidingensis]|uniref:hypothetical protein n=1 Tax=Amycolatopsis aidingensis TaxID=2842453 RepID=UPI001C0E5AF1|nr:hypothetical protein [Amycolatopsis aidingensis]